MSSLNRQERLLWRLLKRRAKVIKLRIQLRQSLRGMDLLDTDKDTAIAGLDQLVVGLMRQARRLARAANWGESLARLQSGNDGLGGRRPTPAMPA